MKIKKKLTPTIKNDMLQLLNKLVEDSIVPTTNKLADSVNTQTNLRYQKQLIDSLEEFKKECCHGIQLMLESLASTITTKEQQELTQEYRLFLEQVATEKTNHKLSMLIEKGKSCREALSLSDFFISSLAQAAMSFFEHDMYEKAIPSFVALCWLDSKNYVYPLFLGFSYFQMKRYKEALYAYAAAAPNAPDQGPLLYMAECFLTIKEINKAKLCAQKGLEEEKLSDSPNKEMIALLEKILHSVRA